ncbi:MAG: T9SS type A sorting domain-containing protein [Candidatus Kapabacteria bacterium]|nr:T9SS type A sorting domain-containing protein [Candidatus Kapabacteria bacterium]
MKKYIIILASVVALTSSIFIFYRFYKFQTGSTASSDEILPNEMDDLQVMKLRDPLTKNIPENIRARELAFAQTLPGAMIDLKYRNNFMAANNWKRLGPYNVGGRTRAIEIDVDNENIIIAAGVSGGIWRSTDAGNSWTRALKPNQLSSVTCITQDTRPGKTNTWYAGTGEYLGNSASQPGAFFLGDGIYKSVDNGISWDLIPSTSKSNPQSWSNSFSMIWSIVINPSVRADINEIYVSVAMGAVVRSTDGGNTWKVVLGGYGNNYSTYTELSVNIQGVFYATMSQAAYQTSSPVKGIFRSVDGFNWTDITPSFMPKNYNRIAIGLSSSKLEQVYFIAETPGSGTKTYNSYWDEQWHSIWKYHYLSGDGRGSGGYWEDLSSHVPTAAKQRGMFNSQGCYDLVIKVKPNDSNAVFIGGTNVYRSTDGFSSDNYTLIGGYNPNSTNYEDYRYPNHHPDIHALLFLPSNPKVLISGSDGGIHKTNDCLASNVEWISLNSGYSTTQFYSIALDRATKGSSQVIGGLQDNSTLYSRNGGETDPWNLTTLGDGLYCTIADGGKTFYSSQNGGKVKVVAFWRFSINDSDKVQIQTRIDPAACFFKTWDVPVLLDPNNNNRMYLGGSTSLWRNNDLSGIPFVASRDSTAINWDSLKFTCIDTSLHIAKKTGFISAADVSRTPANVVYYGSSNGEIFRIDRADTGNPQPVNITPKNFPANAYINCIRIDPENSNEVFVVFSNYNVLSIFYSSNAGIDWKPISGNLEQYSNGSGSGPSCRWLQILNIKGKNLYLLGTSTGLYTTAYIDGMNTVWMQESADLIGNYVVNMIDVRQNDGRVVVGTHGSGSFESYISQLPPSPASPSLTYPSNNRRGVMDTCTFRWKKVPDAFFYKFQIASDDKFINIINEIPGLTTDSVPVTGIEQGLKTFYWRVLATNSGGISSSIETWKFTSAIGSPDLIYPENNKDSLSMNVHFVWNPVQGASSYHIQIANSFTFVNLVADSSNITTNKAYFLLAANKKYYWRVSAKDADAEGLFSKNFYFWTIDLLGVRDYNDKSRNILSLDVYYNFIKSDIFLKYELAQPANIQVLLQDMEGRIIKRIFNGLSKLGNNYSEISVSGLTSGAYFITINSENEIKSKRIVLIR